MTFRRFGAGLLLGVLTGLMVGAAIFIGGCSPGATRANPVEQSRDTISTATYNTSKFTRIGEDGTLNIDTNLPTYASLLGMSAEYVRDADGKIIDTVLVPKVDSAGGGASHEMVVPLGKNQFAVLRSATVFKVHADEYSASPDGTITAKNLDIGSDAAAANTSVAAVVQSLAPTWAKWSEDDRSRFETLVSEMAKLGGTWAQTALEAVKVLKSVTPAAILP